MQDKNLPDCCKPNYQPENRRGILWGIIYGIIPHTFCILFVIFSIVGATSGAVFMKKFMFVPHLFQYLILLSLLFATMSAVIYLKKNKLFSLAGIIKKWKYLSVLFLTTIIINLLFIYWILPGASNITPRSNETNNSTIQTEQIDNTNVQVVKMDQVGGGYRPNSFTIKKDIPVKWIINSKSQSCAASIYSETLGIDKILDPGENIIEFTPKKAGRFYFTCYMGMYSGYFNVVE